MSAIKVDIILIGNQGSGKTSLIKRFVGDKKQNKNNDCHEEVNFSHQYNPTVGINLERRIVYVKDSKGSQHAIDLNIWDTAGQEKHFALTKNFFRRSQGVIVVYDVTDLASFSKIEEFWMKQITDNCKEGTEILLIGNKIDLKDQRVISTVQGENLAKKNNNVPFFETSAKEGVGLEEAFTRMAEMCFRNMEAFVEKEEDEAINLEQKSEAKGFTCWQSIKSKVTNVVSRLSAGKKSSSEIENNESK